MALYTAAKLADGLPTVEIKESRTPGNGPRDSVYLRPRVYAALRIYVERHNDRYCVEHNIEPNPTDPTARVVAQMISELDALAQDDTTLAALIALARQIDPATTKYLAAQALAELHDRLAPIVREHEETARGQELCRHGQPFDADCAACDAEFA